MDLLQAYFYTDTIFGFQHLLADNSLKMIVIDSLKYLVDNQKVKIYGFVIMPNHIHLIWNMLDLNGKESPAGSFAKFTAHQFKKHILQNSPCQLDLYQSDKADRRFQFWKRDPLAILLSSEKALKQKLNYIHNNPVQEKLRLAVLPELYKWSSASFYHEGFDEFGIITDYKL